MKFKIKAEQDKFKIHNYILQTFYKSLEKITEDYKKEGLSKEDILSGLDEAVFRINEFFDEL